MKHPRRQGPSGERSEPMHQPSTLDPRPMSVTLVTQDVKWGIEDAFWVSKKDLKLVLNGKTENFIPARKGTIARYLLEKWVNDEM